MLRGGRNEHRTKDWGIEDWTERIGGERRIEAEKALNYLRWLSTLPTSNHHNAAKRQISLSPHACAQKRCRRSS